MVYDNDWQLVNCNLCGSDRFKDACLYGGIKIVKCEDCGLIYRNPRLRESMNREFYRDNYYGEYDGMEERISLARKAIFKNILSKLQKEILDSSRMLLDIGCGHGLFLKFAKDSGWQVKGVELSKSACDYAAQEFNIEVINKDIEEANLAENYFDVITLWNVLDHLLDPLGVLKEIYRILKLNGILMIRIPNVSFHLFLHKLFSLLPSFIRNKNFRDPSIVVNYGFDNQMIKKILKETGFTRIEVLNSSVSYGDPYKSFGLFKDCITNILKKAYFLFSQIIYYLSLGRRTIGTSLLVFARK